MQWQLISRPDYGCRRTELAFDDDFMEAECVDDGLAVEAASVPEMLCIQRRICNR